KITEFEQYVSENVELKNYKEYDYAIDQIDEMQEFIKAPPEALSVPLNQDNFENASSYDKQLKNQIIMLNEFLEQVNQKREGLIGCFDDVKANLIVKDYETELDKFSEKIKSAESYLAAHDQDITDLAGKAAEARDSLNEVISNADAYFDQTYTGRDLLDGFDQIKDDFKAMTDLVDKYMGIIKTEIDTAGRAILNKQKEERMAAKIDGLIASATVAEGSTDFGGFVTGNWYNSSKQSIYIGGGSVGGNSGYKIYNLGAGGGVVDGGTPFASYALRGSRETLTITLYYRLNGENISTFAVFSTPSGKVSGVFSK
ncbi:MAG: hypothetical protein LBN03_00950, partial [Bifidobacteriaceae bacterium]|nr:hypothetical protein [Bifidobacteriaceae bacterium]